MLRKIRIGSEFHHRGQITALPTQAGQDVGATDRLPLIPEVG